ncbi:MAG: FG-GAP-like repeat-containing protein [Prolixibacteraceae bacterium]|jgi:signal transduction histidine kinase|nr:FG-GAP-like repeat-containing protein [Prolixibacteraceae bacterium]
MHISSYAQSFVRVNSGTKSNIRQIVMLKEDEGFFQADKTYKFNEGVEWIKADDPSVRAISFFSANSAKDFWYAINLENSTSMVYHSVDGITESMVGPFGVSIFAFYVSKTNIAFMCSSSEVAVYEKGKYVKIELAPEKAIIKKIIGIDSHNFWILTNKGKLFFFNGTKYRQLLEDKNVNDFVVVDQKKGYALCQNEIIVFDGMHSKCMMTNEKLRDSEKIFVSPKNEIWLIGSQSKILRIRADGLEDLSLKEKFQLSDLSFAGNEDVWIAGTKGVLLYSGKRNLPPFDQGNPGFSSFKLTNFSIDLDNEYGVALEDFNGDGKIDIFSVCISDYNRLYINKFKSEADSAKEIFFREEGFLRKSEGTFDSKSESSYAELKLGVTVADIDNDGDEDIYICYLNSKNKLLINNGSGLFRDVSFQPNRACDNFERSTAAAFADVDLDGNADLYVTSENGSNKLFKNDGTGHFTDITLSAGLETASGGSCAAFSDINEDGLPDLCVTFWYDRNRVYLNETKKGRITFRDITNGTDLCKAMPVKSNGTTFADINNDGFPDLFIANKNEENKIYLNNGKGNFRDVTNNYLEKNIFLSNGGVFADFDNDGYQDLYLSNVGTNVLYKNVSGLFFKDVTSDFGADMSGYSTGSAVGDLDNDGNIDLYVGNFLGGSSKVFMNQSKNTQTLKLKLEGVHSNRDAIGAKIYLYSKDRITRRETLESFQEISGGGGYASISTKEAIFPIMDGIEYFAIIKFPYPKSEVKVENLQPGRLLIREQSGWYAFVNRMGKMVLRTVKNPEILREYLKTAFIFIIIAIYYWRHIRGRSRINWIRKGAIGVIFLGFPFLNLLVIYSASFWLYVIPIFAVIVLLAIVHLITERIQISVALTKQKVILREKISRDLHDDLASTLGSISIYTDTLKRIEGPVQSDFKRLSLKIAELTQSALQSITDIIWMTSPRNDSLQGLLAKVNSHLYETLTDNGIQYHAEINAPDETILMPDELKNDTFLLLKEAIHNIIRHSGAKTVSFLADVKGSTCSISLMDDGIGFDANKLHNDVSHGNGLINMRRRAEESKIELSVLSQSGKGTIIQLLIKI